MHKHMLAVCLSFVHSSFSDTDSSFHSSLHSFLSGVFLPSALSNDSRPPQKKRKEETPNGILLL